MRKAVGATLCLLFIFAQGIPSYGGENLLPSSNATWLETLNYYRVSAGLNPVIEDTQLSSNVNKHVRYLAASDPKYFVGKYVSRHLENPASPYYSVAGTHSGQEITSTLIPNQYESIDMWMATPFHAMGFLREGLRKVGWGSAYNSRTGFYDTGADIFAGLSTTRTKIITFPGNGSYSRMDSYLGENPDPRESCGSDWRSFSGLPIWVSLLKSPSHQMNAQLTTPDGQVLKSRDQLCIVNEYTMKSSDPIYGSAGKGIIKADHMVLVIPKQHLSPGLQRVSLLIGGKRRISWSFTVIAPPPVISWATTSDPLKIVWSEPPTQPANPTLGYDVIVGDSQLKRFQDFRTTSTVFPASAMDPGNYWVCVKVIGRYRDSACPSYYPLTVN